MGFPRHECWSGFPFPTPGGPPDPGMELMSFGLMHGQADSLSLCHLEDKHNSEAGRATSFFTLL